MTDARSLSCPYTGHKRTCGQIVDKRGCPKFVTIQGTETTVDKKKIPFTDQGCADNMAVGLQTEANNCQRNTESAIIALREDMVKYQGFLGTVFVQAMQRMGYHIDKNTEASLKLVGDDG